MDDMETVTVEPPPIDFSTDWMSETWQPSAMNPSDLSSVPNFDSNSIGELSSAGDAAGGGSSFGGTISSILQALGGGRGIMSDASGIMGLLAANNLKDLAGQALSGSNPFGPYREQYAQQLNTLMANPGSVANDPGFTSSRDQALQQVQKSMAAQGYKGSGNMAAALYDRANNFQLDYTQQKENQLAGLAGANINPNYAPGLNAAAGAAQVQSSGLASLGAGLGYALPQAGLGINSASAGTPLGMSPTGTFNSAGGEAATAISLANSGINMTNNVSKLSGGGNVVSKANGTIGGTIGEAALGLGVYQGIQQGGVAGYAGAATDAALLGAKTGLLSSGVGAAAGYVAAPLAVYNFAENWKSGATTSNTMSGLSAGAAVGSLFGPIGTGVGAVIGGAVGAVSSLFGPGEKDPETASWDKYLPAATKNPQISQQVQNPFLLMAGLFDERSSTLPMYQQYGRMGENKFTSDMTTQINQALQKGTISKTDTPDTIYSKVVAPWVAGMGSGWSKVGPEYTQATQGLLKQMTAQYVQGQQGNWKAVGGQYAFTGGTQGTIQPFGAMGVGSPTASPPPTAPQSPPQQSIMPVMRDTGSMMSSLAFGLNQNFRGLQHA